MNMSVHRVYMIKLSIFLSWYTLKVSLVFREGVKKTQLFRGPFPYQGGGSTQTPFWRNDNMYECSVCPENPFFIKTIFLYYHPFWGQVLQKYL